MSAGIVRPLLLQGITRPAKENSLYKLWTGSTRSILRHDMCSLGLPTGQHVLVEVYVLDSIRRRGFVNEAILRGFVEVAVIGYGIERRGSGV